MENNLVPVFLKTTLFPLFGHTLWPWGPGGGLGLFLPMSTCTEPLVQTHLTLWDNQEAQPNLFHGVEKSEV